METWKLVKELREQIVQLRLNRHIFRTHQEIIRLNPILWGRPNHMFGNWARTVYVSAAASAVRRLASGSSEEGDVSLVRLIDRWRLSPDGLWRCLERIFPNETRDACSEMTAKTGSLGEGWETEATRRVLMSQRASVIGTSDAVNRFASKRIAHHVPDDPVKATFDELDSAIEAITEIAERCTRVYLLFRLDQVAVGSYLAKMLEREAARNLDAEMKTRLPLGWERVFLIPWASEETISQSLGDLKPPQSGERQ
jgi:hypothetical protein